MIIGLTGRIASGKGIFTNYLLDLGFRQISLSQEVREEVAMRGLEIKREILQDIGNEVRIKEGAGAWAKRVVNRIKESKYPNWVVEGIRNPAEITELKKLPDFFLVSIDAPQKIRFERFLRRAKPSDPTLLEDFLKIDDRDFCEEDPSGQQVGKCMKMADFNIINDSTFEKISKDVENIYKKILERKEKC